MSTAPPVANDLLLRAIRREPVPRVPVWLMRQAGRCDPEYRAYRERVGLSLYDLFRAPEHAIPISLLPRRFGVDAIIIYQDILTPLEPMGAVFRFTPGPRLAEPVRSEAQVRALQPCAPERSLGFVGETVRGVHAELAGALPVLGFAGAPFTLAAFMIEGQSPMRDMGATLHMAREQPALFGELIERLTEMTIAYLTYQAGCGVHAVQLFESIGDRIPQDLYEAFAQPSHERIFAALPPELPGILFVRESPFPELMCASGAQVVSLGTSVTLSDVLARNAPQLAVQGNVDNRILAEGTPQQVADAVRQCIASAGGPGHILNLNHGVLPETPLDNVLQMVRTAHETPAPAAP